MTADRAPIRPALPPHLTILDGTDIEAEWDRFEVFEALHHGLDICNPMAPEELDAVVAVLLDRPGQAPATHLDIACGTGELIAHLADCGVPESTGVDLSPWMIAQAAQRCERSPGTRHWILGNARELPLDPAAELVTCLGAEWIWHGGVPTMRAIASRTAPGGRLAMGEMYLRDGLDPAALAAEHGSFLTSNQIVDEMTKCGVTLIDRIDTADSSFDSYLDRTGAAAQRWAERYPGPQSDNYLATHAEWTAAREREAPLLTWSVWIGERAT